MSFSDELKHQMTILSFLCVCYAPDAIRTQVTMTSLVWPSLCRQWLTARSSQRLKQWLQKIQTRHSAVLFSILFFLFSSIFFNMDWFKDAKYFFIVTFSYLWFLICCPKWSFVWRVLGPVAVTVKGSNPSVLRNPTNSVPWFKRQGNEHALWLLLS